MYSKAKDEWSWHFGGQQQPRDAIALYDLTGKDSEYNVVN